MAWSNSLFLAIVLFFFWGDFIAYTLKPPLPFGWLFSANWITSLLAFKAHRKFAFHLLGSGRWPSWYLPVYIAHSRNRSASRSIQSCFSACFHDTLKTPLSRSIDCRPGNLPLPSWICNHSLIFSFLLSFITWYPHISLNELCFQWKGAIDCKPIVNQAAWNTL